jgi:hypothetical protein
MAFTRPNTLVELPLGCLVLLFGLVLGLCSNSKSISIARMQVTGMCCNCKSLPVLRQLASVSGATSARADLKRRELHIELSHTAPVDTAGLWQAATYGRIEPVSLTIDGEEIDRPSR